MTIEILIPTARTLAGCAKVVCETLLASGFQNIDPPEEPPLHVELTNVDMDSWEKAVPDEISPSDLGDSIKANREIVRVQVGLRHGSIVLYPGFVVLARPEDDYEDFESDPRARAIIGREAYELAKAFEAPELVVAGDTATDFLGTDATTWAQLKDVLEDEEIPHKLIALPTKKG